MTGQFLFPEKEHFLIIEDDKGRREILLNEDNYSLGRGTNCDIRLHSQFVSRHHAMLKKYQREDGSSYYRIIDGDAEGKASVNGLLVNNQKVSSHELQDGDKIIFSPEVFAIYYYCQREELLSQSFNDPFDITLINPAMILDNEDGNDTIKNQEK
jgi:pSer/pThr/pTyr-binding forkhead associated (FHA) protein